MMSKISPKGRVVLLVVAIFVGILVLVPSLVLSGKQDEFFVDDDASGTQNGSANHPFRTITQAIDAADKDDGAEIFVRSGTYKENITLGKNIQLIGKDKDKVTIKAKNDDRPVVIMKHKSEIQKITIEKGKHGVLVNDDARVSISKCVIKDNKDNGVKIESAPRTKDRQAFIGKCEIKDNGESGIFSQKRKVVITDNEITENDGDGIFLEKGIEAFIKDNKIKDNDKSGIALEFDGSAVFAKSNSVRDNKREGIEVKAFGKTPGAVDIIKSKFIGNDRWGIAQVVKGANVRAAISGLVIHGDNEFRENKFGTISNIVFVN